MSTSGITSSLLSQIAGSSTEANRFVTDLNQLAQDVQSGNLSAAETDYVTLSEDAQNGTTSSTATTSASGITTKLLSNIASSSASSASFLTELNQLGTDLQSGNSTSAQQDLLALDSTALNAASSSTTASATPVNQAETEELIQAIVQAMGAGDNSLVGTAMSELAAIWPSSAGASVHEQQSASFGSSSSSTSGLTSQLLQSLNTSTPTSSLSLLG